MVTEENNNRAGAPAELREGVYQIRGQQAVFADGAEHDQKMLGKRDSPPSVARENQVQIRNQRQRRQLAVLGSLPEENRYVWELHTHQDKENGECPHIQRQARQ